MNTAYGDESQFLMRIQQIERQLDSFVWQVNSVSDRLKSVVGRLRFAHDSREYMELLESAGLSFLEYRLNLAESDILILRADVDLLRKRLGGGAAR